MPLDDIVTTMGEIGSGEWELRVEGGETIDAFFDEVEVSEERGFHAEGHNDERGTLYELSTGKQPGGPVRLRRRALDAEEWEDVGEVVEAVKLG